MVADYRHGIRLATSVDDKILITLNARSENDRTKFVEDLKEAVLEVCKLLFNIFLCNVDEQSSLSFIFIFL